jgi:hypothetical protein
MNRSDNPVTWVLVAAALAVSAAAGLLLFFFDPSHYNFYPVCLFHRLTGLLCPGCGALRATHQLLHGNLVAAFRLNPLLILSLPLLAWFGAVSAVRILKQEPVRITFPGKWAWLIVGTGLAFSVWRNLPGNHFAMLSP